MPQRKRMTRRSFVKGVTAAVAAPCIVPASALGLGAKEAPSNRVTLGCIGVGSRGTRNMNGLMAAGGQVVAVCDVKADKRERARAAAKLPASAAHNDFHELLDRKDVDAVMVCTPDHWHVLIGIAALKAGKDLYLEKPVGLTIAEGQAIRKVVLETKRVYMNGTEQRSRPRTRHVCELIRNGRIGKLHTVHAACPGGRTLGSPPVTGVPQGLDYDFWLGPAPKVPYRGQTEAPSFFFISDYTSAGFICNWGVHIMDIVHWAMGTDDTGPVEIEGSATFPPKVDLADTALTWKIKYKYANGVTVFYTDSSGAPPHPDGRPHFREGAVFEGTEGTIGWAYNNFEPYSNPSSILKSKIGPDDIHLYEARDSAGNLCGDDACFLACVKSRKETCSPIEAAHRSTSVGYLADIAVQLGRKLYWDPEKERFKDDAEANKMLSRPMRAPWHL